MRSTDPADCYTYAEQRSKNILGGLAQLRHKNKRVPCYSVPEDTPQCLVFLLDKYVEKLPLFTFTNNILYCRPKKDVPYDNKSCWYDAVPVGKNKLGSMVKDMCAEAGIEKKMNHSPELQELL